ncbi:Putative transposable element [Caligus rogercresseyi]|uniref:Transposable element n=1 Tax=Caligus rogercresseyi TaxID=217165 RepID=A0A7T8H049_CALRO|nr:Putative transposable element [Caligus rogercresseyi]
MPPFWFPKGLKIGAKEYLEVMQNVVKPWLDATYPEGNYVFQQDNAPGHKAKITQKWCEENLAAFWPWSMWPPSSPDCNPLDYGIWGVVERKACSIPHASVDALKAAVEKERAEMSVDFIVKTCKAFRPRIKAMLKATGGHFEL